MEYLIVLVLVPTTAVVIGWLYGRNTVSPYTTKGKAYYNPTKED